MTVTSKDTYIVHNTAKGVSSHELRGNHTTKQSFINCKLNSKLKKLWSTKCSINSLWNAVSSLVSYKSLIMWLHLYVLHMADLLLICLLKLGPHYQSCVTRLLNTHSSNSKLRVKLTKYLSYVVYSNSLSCYGSY